MSTTPAPRILVRGDLRTIADLPADKAALTATVAASPYADEQGRHYAVTDEAVHSQRPVFAVRATGEWTCELVWATGVVYRISAPGWMPDVMVYCDTLTPPVDGSAIEVAAKDLIDAPGGATPVEWVTLTAVIASIDAKVASAAEDYLTAHPAALSGAVDTHLGGDATNLVPTVNGKVAKGDLVVDAADYGLSATNTAAQNDVALAAAMAATPAGGALFIRRGRYPFNTFTRKRGRRIIGQGWQAKADALGAFGDADYLNPTWLDGTILLCQATTGVAVDLEIGSDNQAGCPMDGVAIVGPGTGTTIGYQGGSADGSGGGRAVLDENNGAIGVFNFAQGINLQWVENSTWDMLVIRGCANPGVLGWATNVNTFNNLNIQRCNGPLTMDTTTTSNLFQMVCLQGNTGVGMRVLGKAHKLDVVYMENPDNAGTVALEVGGTRNEVCSPMLTLSKDGITVLDGAVGTRITNPVPGVDWTPVVLTNNGIATVVQAAVGLTNFTFTDNGTYTVLIDTATSTVTAANLTARTAVRAGNGTAASNVYVNTKSDQPGGLIFQQGSTTAWQNIVTPSDPTNLRWYDNVGRLHLMLTKGAAANTAKWQMYAVPIIPSSNTAGRPLASIGAGAMWYDTTLAKPIWSDGTTWRDAAGTAV